MSQHVVFFIFSFVAVVLCQNNSTFGKPTFSSYFGGSGDDSITSVVYMTSGSIIIGGTTTSNDGPFKKAPHLGGSPSSGGFIASLSGDGSKVEWIYLTSPVASIEYNEKNNELVASGASIAFSLSTDGKKVNWNVTSFGECTSCTVRFFKNGDTLLLRSGGWVRISDGKVVLSHSVKKSRMPAITVDVDDHVIVGGDQSSHTCCEPWRDPYIFIEDATVPKAPLQGFPPLWDFNPKLVHTDHLQLQADSFFNFLTTDHTGKVWVSGSSDGGNTVFTRNPYNLTELQTAAEGKCLSSPCFGYKGANKATWIGAFTNDFSNLETQSWHLAYVGVNRTTPCQCLGGKNVHPNGIKMTGVTFLGTQTEVSFVVTYGNSASRLPETSNRWYTPVSGTGGFVSIFDAELKQLLLSTYLIGTKGVNSASALISKNEVAFGGIAGNPSGRPDSIPCTKCTQKSYGGGDSDGFLWIASSF